MRGLFDDEPAAADTDDAGEWEGADESIGRGGWRSGGRFDEPGGCWIVYRYAEPNKPAPAPIVGATWEWNPLLPGRGGWHAEYNGPPPVSIAPGAPGVLPLKRSLCPRCPHGSGIFWPGSSLPGWNNRTKDRGGWGAGYCLTCGTFLVTVFPASGEPANGLHHYHHPPVPATQGETTHEAIPDPPGAADPDLQRGGDGAAPQGDRSGDDHRLPAAPAAAAPDDAEPGLFLGAALHDHPGHPPAPPHQRAARLRRQLEAALTLEARLSALGRSPLDAGNVAIVHRERVRIEAELEALERPPSTWAPSRSLF